MQIEDNVIAKSIFITGGASGIGRAVAHYFGARDWKIGLADINDAGMRETAATLQDGQCSIHHLDVAHADQWEKALAEFAEFTGGQMHVMINNAGVGIGGILTETTLEEIDILLNINFKGVVIGAKLAHPYLKATKGSCLLNTSSASGIYGSPGLCVYSATKFAVRGLSEALDIEWREDDIRVRALLPSFIDTPLLDRVAENENMSSKEKVASSGLEISPVEIVAKAAWEAVHNEKNVHSFVGKTARQMAFAARWMPNMLRKRASRFVDNG